MGKEVTVTHKQCRKCKITKPADQFYKRAAHKDGLRSYCKQCEIEDVGKYQKTPDGKETQRRYAKSEKGKVRMRKFDRSEKGREKHSRYNRSEKGRTYSRTARQRNIEKARARDAVNNAVKQGKMLPPKSFICSHYRCNKQADEYHHYLGYDPENWLKVKPICIPCHRVLEPRPE